MLPVRHRDVQDSRQKVTSGSAWKQETYLRQTGLAFLGEVPWGTHLCQFYHQREELVESQVSFLAAGLKESELCLLIHCDGDEVLSAIRSRVPGFDRHLKGHRLEVVTAQEWYFNRSGQFDPDGVFKKIRQKVTTCQTRGLAGLRVTGGIRRITRLQWTPFVDYDTDIQKGIRRQPLIALCVFYLPDCPIRQMNRIIAAHHYSFVKKGARWEVIRNLS